MRVVARAPAFSGMASLGCLLGCLLLGCSSEGNLHNESPWQVKVVCEQRPLTDVHVVVHRPLGSQWEAVLEGVTNGDGIAFLQAVPTIDPPQTEEWTKFGVTLESFAGGEWMIKPKWSNPISSGLKLEAIQPNVPVTIELPKQAIAPL